MVCDSVEQLITKGQNFYARKCMLTDKTMEILGFSMFDEHVDSYPTNLQIDTVEDQREQTISTIQSLSQVDVASFRLIITAPPWLFINLQGFLDS